ncbi:sucrose synthase [bacterium]|nr:sucrose synthase [candidate division CSSED10-310 bacterium]
MIEKLRNDLDQYKMEIHALLRRYIGQGKMFLLRSELKDEFDRYCNARNCKILAQTQFADMIHLTQEAVASDPWFSVAVRPRIGIWLFFRFHLEEMSCDEITAAEFLMVKESILDPDSGDGKLMLEVDLKPFNRDFPKMKEAKSIGQGMEFLNRYLSNRIFKDLGKGHTRLFDFLTVHQIHGRQLMINSRIGSLGDLQEALRKAQKYLLNKPDREQWNQLAGEMQKLGFEPGWGSNAGTVLESINELQDILEAPEPGNLRNFLSRIPMIFDLAIISPHGYFGQSNVLGMPDTGGQIVYILEQVRSLEKELFRQIQDYGLEVKPQIIIITRMIPEAGKTKCNRKTERIIGTRNAKIVRVPFRNESGEVIRHWISRFKVYPYLERFAAESEKEIIAEIGRRPDLVIGNYTDGNLVASLISRSLKITQCNIAHALEKAKYIYSDLYWRELESIHHFSCQFTADLIAMNRADFIITSTYHEIAGNDESIGQYESYRNFTMPGLYRVLNGIDVYDPKFNIVSPGPASGVFFPHTKTRLRNGEIQEEIQQLVYGDAGQTARGDLKDKSKPLIFTLARLDVIKNIAGLAEWFGKSGKLQKKANLLVAGGYLNRDLSSDREEREQIARMHMIMDRYKLDGSMRWIEMQTRKHLVAELFRFVADSGGVFVQPALFEAFGLTVVEAMISGLPTFATCYGGPREIIEHGKSGFHIDPNHGDTVAGQLVDFFNRCETDDKYWARISTGGIRRVEKHYNWQLYARRLISLAKIYGFWKYVSDLERQETDRYLQMFYSLMFRKQANAIID